MAKGEQRVSEPSSTCRTPLPVILPGPPALSVEELSSTKEVPGAKKVGDLCA